MLATHEARKEKAIKDSIDRVSNPAHGLCKECDHKLYKTGKNKTRCEYHWLKNKYNGFSSKCRIANEGGIVPYELTFLIKIMDLITYLIQFDSIDYVRDSLIV